MVPVKKALRIQHRRLLAGLVVLGAISGGCEATDPPPRLPAVVDPLRADAGPDADRCLADVPGTVGPTAPCGCAADCAGADPVCLTELRSGVPGGQCLASCDPAGDPVTQCGPGATCADLGGDGIGLCSLGCTSREDCPAGGLCNGFGLCERFCQRDADCDSGFCDPYARECAEGPVNPEGAALFATCLRNEDCRSAFCVAFGAGSHCATSCDVARPDTCPDGGLCVPLGPGSESGTCLLPCDGETEACPHGLTCTTFPWFSGERVCFVG